MKKTCFSLLCSILLLVSLTACGGQEDAPPPEPEAETGTIQLTVWGAEEDEALLQEIFASFQSHYAGQASFQITFQPQSESNCKDAMLGDLEGGADVFAFADDQVSALAAAGGLDPKRQPLRGGGGGQRGRLPLRLPPDGGQRLFSVL